MAYILKVVYSAKIKVKEGHNIDLNRCHLICRCVSTEMQMLSKKQLEEVHMFIWNVYVCISVCLSKTEGERGPENGCGMGMMAVKIICDKIMTPQDGHILIPRTFKCVTLYDKTDFADVIKVRILRQDDDHESSVTGQGTKRAKVE